MSSMLFVYQVVEIFLVDRPAVDTHRCIRGVEKVQSALVTPSRTPALCASSSSGQGSPRRRQGSWTVLELTRTG